MEGQIPDPDTHSLPDRGRCQAVGIVPGENRMLNVATLLELGGRHRADVWWPAEVSTRGGYEGCVRNLKHNGKVSYRLPHSPADCNLICCSLLYSRLAKNMFCCFSFQVNLCYSLYL